MHVNPFAHGNMVIFVRKAGNMFTINTSINDVSRAKFQMILLGDFSHPWCHCLGGQLVERRQQLSLGPGTMMDRVPTKKRLGFFEALPGFFFKKRCWKLKKCWPFASYSQQISEKHPIWWVVFAAPSRTPPSLWRRSAHLQQISMGKIWKNWRDVRYFGKILGNFWCKNWS